MILLLIPSKSMEVHHPSQSVWKQNDSTKPQLVELDHQSFLGEDGGEELGYICKSNKPETIKIFKQI